MKLYWICPCQRTCNRCRLASVKVLHSKCATFIFGSLAITIWMYFKLQSRYLHLCNGDVQCNTNMKHVQSWHLIFVFLHVLKVKCMQHFINTKSKHSLSCFALAMINQFIHRIVVPLINLHETYAHVRLS